MQVIGRASRQMRVAPVSLIKSTAIVVCAILSVIVLHLLLHPVLIPAEAAMHLEAGRLLAQGKVPYVDFFETAAPMLIYLNAVPSIVSDFLPLHPIQVFNLFVFFTLCLSIAGTAYILFSCRSRDQAVYPYLLIGFAATNLVFIGEFGQAEHLMVMLTLPYIVFRYLRWSDRATSDRAGVVAGAFAAVGFLLKPIFLLLLVGLELCWWLNRPRKYPLVAPEITSLAAVMSIYFFHLFILPTEMQNRYVNWAFPAILYDYRLWDTRLIYMDKTPDRRDLLYFMVLVSILSLAARKWCSLLPTFVLMAVLGFGLFFIPGKMLTFEALPMVYGASIAASLLVGVVLNYLAGMKAGGGVYKVLSRPVAYGAAILIVCSMGIMEFQKINGVNYLDLRPLGYVGSTPKDDLANFSELLIKETNPEDQVLVISDRVRPAFPLLLQLNRKPGARLLNADIMRVFHNIEEQTDETTYNKVVYANSLLYEELIDDIDKRQPKLIMLEEEALGPLLEQREVKLKIQELYEPIGMADYEENKAKHPRFEYLGFRSPLQVFKLRSAMDEAR